MENISPEQFAESVKTAIGTVTHFYSQIDRLNSSLNEALTSDEDGFSILGGIPPQPGRRKDARVIRYDYGFLFSGDNASDGDLDEEDLDDVLGADDELDKPKRRKRFVEIFPDQPVLVLHTVLYDPKRSDQLEPTILYAALNEWRCGTKQTKSKEDEAFRLRRYMSWRVIRAINHRTNASAGGRISTRAIVTGRGRGGPKNPELELSARLLAPIESAALYNLDGSGAIEKLADKIKAYWQEHVVSAKGQ